MSASSHPPLVPSFDRRCSADCQCRTVPGDRGCGGCHPDRYRDGEAFTVCKKHDDAPSTAWHVELDEVASIDKSLRKANSFLSKSSERRVPGWLAPVTRTQRLAHGALVALNLAGAPLLVFLIGFLFGRPEPLPLLWALTSTLLITLRLTSRMRQEVWAVYGESAVWKTSAEEWKSAAKKWKEVARESDAKLKAFYNLPESVWDNGNELRKWAIRILSGEPLDDMPTQEEYEEKAVHKSSVKDFSPADYLKSLKWDGQLRLDASLGPGNAEGAELFFRNAVRRALNPGCALESTAVLVGPQGCDKSLWLNEVTGPFSDTVHGVGGLCTFSVLGAPAHTSNELSPQWSNSQRFCVVHVGQLDVEAVRRDRDQLWAEAVERFGNHV
jgi:hypothetical protein